MRRLILFVFALLLPALLGACSPALRDDAEAVLVSLDGLSRSDDRVVLVLALRNPNATAQSVQPQQLRLRVADQLLLDWTRPGGTELGARARESLTLSGPGQAEGLRVLAALAADGVSQPWALELVLLDARGRERPLEASGFLHRVPGRADQFR